MGSSSSKSKPVINEVINNAKKDLKYPINNITNNIKKDIDIKATSTSTSSASLNSQLNSSLHLELSKSQTINKPSKKSKNLLDDAMNSPDLDINTKIPTKLYTTSEFNSKLRDLQFSSHRKYEETIDFTNSELKEPVIQDELERDLLDPVQIETINKILKKLSNKNTKLAKESRLIFANNNDQRDDVTQQSRKSKQINLEDTKNDNIDMVSIIDTSTLLPPIPETSSSDQSPPIDRDERNGSLIANIHKISSNIVTNNVMQNTISNNRSLPKDRSPSSSGLNFDLVPKGQLDHYTLLELFVTLTKAPEIPLTDVASHYNISETDIRRLIKHLKLPYLVMHDDRLVASPIKVPGSLVVGERLVGSKTKEDFN